MRYKKVEIDIITSVWHVWTDLDPPKRHNGIPDDGIVSCVTALGCLRSPPISSIIADVKNAKSNQGQHRCLPKGAAASPGPATSTALDDLIHLPGPLTEDAVLKCLQARFCAKQYHVSSSPLSRSTDLNLPPILLVRKLPPRRSHYRSKLWNRAEDPFPILRKRVTI